MAQVITRTQSQQGSRNPIQNDNSIAINWTRVRMVLQTILLLAFPVGALWLSIENEFLFTTEIAFATIIIALVAFIRLAGAKN
jgi:hypothetical protein